MLSANFKPKRIAAASRGFLAIARLSCLPWCSFFQSLRFPVPCHSALSFAAASLIRVSSCVILIRYPLPGSSTPYKPWSKCSIIKLGGFSRSGGKLVQPVDPQACFQMRFSGPECPKNRRRLGLHLRPHWRSLQHSPRLPSWI